MEGFGYAVTRLGLVAADEVARYYATNGERDKQNQAFVINLFRDYGLVALILVAGEQLQKESRSWLSPPDPSPNYNSGCEIHQDGTAEWFFQGSLFNKWNEKGSLLWIYGKRAFQILASLQS
jgi:hypothetical protein